MKDLVTRLRTWVHAVDAVSASDLMDEAANEMELLLGYRDAAEADRTVALLAAERMRQVLSQKNHCPDPDKVPNEDNYLAEIDKLNATITSLSGDRSLFQNLARQFAEHATRAKKRIEELEAIRRSNNNLRADLEDGLQEGVVRLQAEVRRLEEVIAARQPALTDEERAAISFAADAYRLNDDDHDCWKIANTLRSLLERLSDRS